VEKWLEQKGFNILDKYSHYEYKENIKISWAGPMDFALEVRYFRDGENIIFNLSICPEDSGIVISDLILIAILKKDYSPVRFIASRKFMDNEFQDKISQLEFLQEESAYNLKKEDFTACFDMMLNKLNNKEYSSYS